MEYVCGALCLVVLALPSARLLQGIGYRPERGYFRIFLSGYFVLLCVAQGVVAFMWASGAPLWGTVLVYLVSAAISLCVPRRCPLVFTARVKRLTAVVAAINLALCFAELRVAAVLQPSVTLAAWLVTLPVERAISAKYRNKASKRLANGGATIVAVTGSYGKTGVKNMLTELLDDAACPEGSCNTPDGIAKFVNGGGADGKRYVVLEFGARQSGDIEELCKLYPPDCGVITGVCEQHLATFKNLENIIREKSSLVSALPADGVCVLADDEMLRRNFDKGNCRKVWAGEHVKADKTGKDIDGTDLSVRFVDSDERFETRLPQIADYIAGTFCLCAETCLALGKSPREIMNNAGRIKQTPHRMQVVKCGFYVVDDGYNASSAGVADSCKTIAAFDGYKIAVAQGIVEGGKENKRLNEQCGRMLGQTFDKVIVVGKNSASLERGLAGTGAKCCRAKNLTEATEEAKRSLAKGDILYYQNDIPDF